MRRGRPASLVVRGLLESAMTVLRVVTIIAVGGRDVLLALP